MSPYLPVALGDLYALIIPLPRTAQLGWKDFHAV